VTTPKTSPPGFEDRASQRVTDATNRFQQHLLLVRGRRALIPQREAYGGFAFDPHDPSGLSMLGSSGGSVSGSADGGKTWMPRGEIPGFSESPESNDWVPTDIEWSRQYPSVVYLAGPYARVLKSTDRGATWQLVLSSAALPE
jgi:photosystem II stability/assembly factor-like uncharacterized protein